MDFVVWNEKNKPFVLIQIKQTVSNDTKLAKILPKISIFQTDKNRRFVLSANVKLSTQATSLANVVNEIRLVTFVHLFMYIYFRKYGKLSKWQRAKKHSTHTIRLFRTELIGIDVGCFHWVRSVHFKRKKEKNWQKEAILYAFTLRNRMNKIFARLCKNFVKPRKKDEFSSAGAARKKTQKILGFNVIQLSGALFSFTRLPECVLMLVSTWFYMAHNSHTGSPDSLFRMSECIASI